MGTKMDQERFNQLINKMVDGKSIFSAVMKAESGDGTVSWSAAAIYDIDRPRGCE